MKWIIWAALAIPGTSWAQSATLYKCIGADGITSYVKQPIAGATCVVISQYRSQQLSSPPSILPTCMDAPGGTMLTSPSLRSEECTRIVCETPKLKAKIRVYGLSQSQTEEDSTEALTCLMRRRVDSRSRP